MDDERIILVEEPEAEGKVQGGAGWEPQRALPYRPRQVQLPW